MGTIYEKTDYLSNTKTAIKNALTDAGIAISSNDTFRSYAQKINDFAIIKKIADLEKLKQNLPYTQGTGKAVTLEDTQELQLKDIQIQGNSQAYIAIPAEYQAVEYIQATGSQYIDTGLSLPENFEIRIKAQAHNPYVNNDVLIATSMGSNRHSFSHYLREGGNQTQRYTYGTTYSKYIDLPRTLDIQEFVMKKDKIIADGVEYQVPNSSDTITPTRTIHFFADRDQNRYGQCKLFYCAIYDGNTLISYLVPCYRKNDDVIGLYDVIRQQFLTNGGSGTFTKGQDVSSMSESGIYSVSGNINITISSDNIEDEPQTLTFPLLEGQKLCRRNNTEYDYLSDDGIVNILEQIDFSGLKSLEESFAVRQEPIITPYTEAQQEAYDRIKQARSYNNTTYISSTNEISPIFQAKIYQKSVIRPQFFGFRDTPIGYFNETNSKLIDGTYLTSLQNSFRGCQNLTEVDLTTIDTTKVTSMQEICNSSRNLRTFKIGDTPNVTTLYGVFGGCSSLRDVSIINTSKVTSMNTMFNGCSNLSNESLNNILAMCINAVVFTGTKTLAHIGLSQSQANVCQTLPNWDAFVAAGWSTGY